MSVASSHIGHNNPPSDLDIVKARLDEKERPIRAALAAITEKPVPETIEDEATAGQITDRIKSLKNVQSGVDADHKEVKKPYLDCGREVDAWKNGMSAEITSHVAQATKPLNAFLNKKAEEERARLAAIAAAEREKAEKLAREAEALNNANITDVANEVLDAAVQSDVTAARIEKNVAFARNGNLAKARSFGGAVASQKTAWVGRITSMAAIDLEALRPHLTEDAVQKALNAFVKAGGRKIGGAEIKEEITGLSVR